jgi:hypothetical protein
MNSLRLPYEPIDRFDRWLPGPRVGQVAG